MLQEFADTIFALKMPSHPNVVRPIGVTMNRFQVVVEQDSDENMVVEYLKRHPDANRIDLVSSPVYHTKRMTMTLSSFKLLDVAEALNFIHTNGFLKRVFTGVCYLLLV